MDLLHLVSQSLNLLVHALNLFSYRFLFSLLQLDSLFVELGDTDQCH